jgi:hypothetical protein
MSIQGDARVRFPDYLDFPADLGLAAPADWGFAAPADAADDVAATYSRAKSNRILPAAHTWQAVYAAESAKARNAAESCAGPTEMNGF